jgi:hypothetical protein
MPTPTDNTADHKAVPHRKSEILHIKSHIRMHVLFLNSASIIQSISRKGVDHNRNSEWIEK